MYNYNMTVSEKKKNLQHEIPFLVKIHILSLRKE